MSGEPIIVIADPDDPGYVWMNRCILCGLPGTEHTEEACAAKLAASPGPIGILATLASDGVARLTGDHDGCEDSRK